MELLRFKDSASSRDAVSLFSGAMGLDLDLERAGVNIAIGQDIDPACAATMRANGRKLFCGDIRGIAADALLDAAGLERAEPFLSAAALHASRFPPPASGWGLATRAAASSWTLSA